MSKASQKYILIMIGVAGVVIFTLVIFNYFNGKNSQQRPAYVDISHVYTVEDFPNHDLDEENLDRFLSSLNMLYDLLRQNVDYDHYDIWIDIGNKKMALNGLDGAEAAWSYAVSLNVDRPLAYANLANLYKDFKQDYEKADEYYDLVITKDNEGYFPDYQNYAELHILYLPEDPDKVETIMLYGADKALDQNKVAFYYYLYKYFDTKNQIKSDFYRGKVLEIDPDFDWSQYQ